MMIEQQLTYADWAREKVHVEQCEVEEEYPRKEMHSLSGPNAYCREDFTYPHHTQDSECQEFVAIKLNQEEYHSHHYWYKH